MTEFTIERVFSDPDLNGPVPRGVQFSPDGSKVTWLQGSADDSQRLDLWHYDIDRGASGVLVASDSLARESRVLSDEEKARRERRRVFESGIVEYFWHPDGKAVLFPLDGTLFLYELETGETRQITDGHSFQTDIRFSPDGRYLSFVREKNLFVVNLENLVEQQLTQDGGGTISNGLAEFIAQEEMHRYEGYWWSPDSQRIAFVRVDESTVTLTHRFEIDADNVSIFDQRYPFTGEANAAVDVGIVSLDGDVSWVRPERDPESYIARIHWLADSRRLALQIQSRDQQISELMICDPESEARIILTEGSESWINLNDHFRTLGDSGDLLVGSERSGFMHLYRLSESGELTQLTGGEYVVLRVAHVDVEADTVWFEANRDTRLETHLYRASLSAMVEPERVTRESLTHATVVSPDGKHFLDRYSGPDQPISIDLCHVSGDVASRISANDLVESHPAFPFIQNANHLSFGTLHASDGQELQYALMEPLNRQAGKRYPVIVQVYGGPGVQRVTRDWAGPYPHYMASRGYGILRLDNRGSANRGKRFESPIYEQLGVCEVEDQLVGVEFLKTLPWVDPERLGVFGHSYGGYMTLMLLMKSPGTFRAGISVAPVTDWHLYDTHYTERYLGHPGQNPEGYERSAVYPWVCGLQDKLLLIHGMADDNVLFTNTTKLMKVLQDSNVDFELMTYPGAKHGIAGRATNIHRYGLMDRFLDRWLGDRL